MMLLERGVLLLVQRRMWFRFFFPGGGAGVGIGVN